MNDGASEMTSDSQSVKSRLSPSVSRPRNVDDKEGVLGRRSSVAVDFFGRFSTLLARTRSRQRLVGPHPFTLDARRLNLAASSIVMDFYERLADALRLTLMSRGGRRCIYRLLGRLTSAAPVISGWRRPFDHSSPIALSTARDEPHGLLRLRLSYYKSTNKISKNSHR